MMQKGRLYLITKLQNLKAIHNRVREEAIQQEVVSNYKITKSESYSQPIIGKGIDLEGCI